MFPTAKVIQYMRFTIYNREES